MMLRERYKIVIASTIATATLMNDFADIDWEQLHQISEDDPEFELELLTMLAEDVKIHIDELRQAVACRDILAIGHEAHYIKGASANVGIISLTAAAKQIEALATNQLLPDIAPIIEQMAIDLNHLETYLGISG
jgi:HPt (histidine-containing phosphotransfer) domain-containing protein